MRRRTYGLSDYDATIVVRERAHADYFEDLVVEMEKHRPSTAELPPQCAKFIINELMAAAKRNKIDLATIPLPLAARLLVARQDRAMTNKDIKITLDRELSNDRDRR